MLVVPVWDPFTLIDPAERATLSAFIDDLSTTVHLGEYDALKKSSFQLILTSGSWLSDLRPRLTSGFIHSSTLYDPNNTMNQDSFQYKNVKFLWVLFSYLFMVYGYYDLYPELKVEGPADWQGGLDQSADPVLLDHFVWSSTGPADWQGGLANLPVLRYLIILC
ncbi:hypothetical protein FNV43_RR22756 [Rhamnella rubrinervis]|uniref:Uncharacterized protein n=1 Tax=Rhamnella rubrinervis TaxID=2594499 RepID=A0A8K0DR18_9ROSA|nr:hypothetical protein FNV43_RR22756 [Rhamnella rubrinervis]